MLPNSCVAFKEVFHLKHGGFMRRTKKIEEHVIILNNTLKEQMKLRMKLI
jgi:hypothetical protein